jgi:FtsZ-binding cell division protein ZapB
MTSVRILKELLHEQEDATRSRHVNARKLINNFIIRGGGFLDTIKDKAGTLKDKVAAAVPETPEVQKLRNQIETLTLENKKLKEENRKFKSQIGGLIEKDADMQILKVDADTQEIKVDANPNSPQPTALTYDVSIVTIQDFINSYDTFESFSASNAAHPNTKGVGVDEDLAKQALTYAKKATIEELRLDGNTLYYGTTKGGKWHGYGEWRRKHDKSDILTGLWYNNRLVYRTNPSQCNGKTKAACANSPHCSYEVSPRGIKKCKQVQQGTE